MKKIRIRSVVKNKSRYPIDLVWENAQDLEHVAFLHRRTNHSFRLLHNEKHESSPYPYDLLSYSSKRLLAGLVPVTSFGFRRIVSEFNLHQVEIIPLLGWTSILNSQLLQTQDPEFPTLMRDEVIIELPWFFKPLSGWISRNLQRHASIQCEEDEPFRARRQELRKRGIKLPLSIFNVSEYLQLKAELRCELGKIESE